MADSASGGNDERRTQNAKVQAETSVPLSRGPVVLYQLVAAATRLASLGCLLSPPLFSIG